MTTLLARINARLDEIEAGPAVIAVAVFLAVSLVALIFGNQTVLNVVLIVAVAIVAWNGGLLHSRVDEALDRSDLALDKNERVENHLTGLEKPGTGKHSKGRAA